MPGWQAIDCGPAPENFTGRVRALAPRRLVVVDAAVMGLVPGSLRRLRPEDLAAAAVPGHRLPWPLLAGYLARLCSHLTLVAVEPLSLEPGTGLSRPVLRAARRLTRLLSRNRLDALPLYGPGKNPLDQPRQGRKGLSAGSVPAGRVLYCHRFPFPSET